MTSSNRPTSSARSSSSKKRAAYARSTISSELSLASDRRSLTFRRRSSVIGAHPERARSRDRRIPAATNMFGEAGGRPRADPVYARRIPSSGDAENDERDDHGKDSEEVHSARDDGDPVIIGVEPDPVGSHGRVVGDQPRYGRGHHPGQQRDPNHLSEPWTGQLKDRCHHLRQKTEEREADDGDEEHDGEVQQCERVGTSAWREHPQVKLG